MESAPTENNVILIHTVGDGAFDVPLRTKVTFISNREGRPLPYGKMDIVRDVSYKFSKTILREWRSRDKKVFRGCRGRLFKKSPLLFQNNLSPHKSQFTCQYNYKGTHYEHNFSIKITEKKRDTLKSRYKIRYNHLRHRRAHKRARRQKIR